MRRRRILFLDNLKLPSYTSEDVFYTWFTRGKDVVQRFFRLVSDVVQRCFIRISYVVQTSDVVQYFLLVKHEGIRHR